MKIFFKNFKILILKFLIIVVFITKFKIYAVNIQIQLEGLDDVLTFDINSKLSSLVKNTNISSIDYFLQSKIRNIIFSSLRASGYYSPEVKFFLYRSFLSRYKKEGYLLVVQINPGIPIKISQINIILNGDFCHDSDYQKLLSEVSLLTGKVLNHVEYDNFKKKLLHLSLSKGYLDAKFRISQLLVFPYSYQSFWNIDFDSGQRYCFGTIKFYGGQVKEEYLRNLLKIDPGTYYDNKILVKLNYCLFATKWFNSVVIAPDVLNVHNVKDLPINVFLVPVTTGNFEVSVGYSSDVSARLRIMWKHPCINIYGHSFENIFGVSMLEKFIDLSYKIPLIRSPLQEYYLFQSSVQQDNRHSYRSNLVITMNVARHWDSIAGWKRSVNFHWFSDYYCHRLGQSESLRLIYPSVVIKRIRQRGGMMPIWGDSQYYSMNISDKLWKSSIDFFILQAKNTWIRALCCCKHRFIVRNDIGWIESDNFYSIFSFIRRFFFVSDFLIRGYKYQSLFFKTSTLNSLIVPSKLVIFSLEHQYNFFEKWWSALFFDGGVMINKHVDIVDYDVKFGIGFGIRWRSPLGPVRLDFATPMFSGNKVGYKLFHLYVSVGPEL